MLTLAALVDDGVGRQVLEGDEDALGVADVGEGVP